MLWYTFHNVLWYCVFPSESLDVAQIILNDFPAFICFLMAYFFLFFLYLNAMLIRLIEIAPQIPVSIYFIHIFFFLLFRCDNCYSSFFPLSCPFCSGAHPAFFFFRYCSSNLWYFFYFIFIVSFPRKLFFFVNFKVFFFYHMK